MLKSYLASPRYILGLFSWAMPFLFGLFSSQKLKAQGYQSVVVETETIDSNATIFSSGSLFLYEFSILRENKEYQLKGNRGMADSINFNLTYSSNSQKAAKNFMLILGKSVHAENTTATNQNEIVSIFPPFLNEEIATDAVENDGNVWMQPPFVGFFSALKLAPYPYVRLPVTVGDVWFDAAAIEAIWGHPNWLEWEGLLQLNYRYQVVEKEVIHSEFGDLSCDVIAATAMSNFGESSLIAHFSPRYGFVSMQYTLPNDWVVAFRLVKVLRDVDTTLENRNVTIKKLLQKK